jgi:hypothetical protein
MELFRTSLLNGGSILDCMTEMLALRLLADDIARIANSEVGPKDSPSRCPKCRHSNPLALVVSDEVIVELDRMADG